MTTLQSHIEAQNAKVEAWVAEAPESRWAGLMVSDPSHWDSYGITTVAQYDHYMATEAYNNAYKDQNGYSAGWIDFGTLTTEEINIMLDALYEQGRVDDMTESEIAAEWKPTPAPINNPFAKAFGKA